MEPKSAAAERKLTAPNDSLSEEPPTRAGKMSRLVMEFFCEEQMVEHFSIALTLAEVMQSESK